LKPWLNYKRAINTTVYERIEVSDIAAEVRNIATEIIVTPLVIEQEEMKVNEHTLPFAPETLSEFEKKKPYIVDSKGKFGKLFNDIEYPDFVVFPIIGFTGQGKTTTMAKLLDPTVDSLLETSPLEPYVKNGTNNSTVPILLYWDDWVPAQENPVDNNGFEFPASIEATNKKIFLLDLPGIGGVKDSIVDCFGNKRNKEGDLASDFVELLKPYKHFISAALLVLKDVVTEPHLLFYKKLESLKDMQFLICYNAESHIKINHKYYTDRMNDYKKDFQKIDIKKDFIAYCAFHNTNY
jgi:hypothetical protein